MVAGCRKNGPLSGPGSAFCQHLRPGRRAGRVGPRGGQACRDAMPCALPGYQVAAGHNGCGGFPRALGGTGRGLGLADLGAFRLPPLRALGTNPGHGAGLAPPGRRACCADGSRGGSPDPDWCSSDLSAKTDRSAASERARSDLELGVRERRHGERLLRPSARMG
jgi:hypothetical protein